MSAETFQPTLLCPRCESDHVQSSAGYRLPSCLSCGLAFDTPAISYADAAALAYSPEWIAEAEELEPDLHRGDGWALVFESFTVLELDR